MNYQSKTKKELIKEFQELQQVHNSLKASSEKNITNHKEIEKDINRQSGELATLSRITEELATALDQSKTLQNIADRVTELTELKSSAIYLLEGETLRLWATSPPLPLEFPDELCFAPLYDHPHIHEAITTNQPVFLVDTTKANLTAAERGVCELRSLRSLLYLPLFVGTQSLGVLIVSSSEEPKRLSEAEINLLSTFANLAAIGVGNASLYESQKSFARELENRIIQIKQIEKELYKAKEKAEESENKYKTLFDANTDGITMFRLVGEESPPIIMDMNENAYKMLGFSRDEMLSMNPADLETNVTKENLDRRVYELKTKGFFNFETTLRHKNGCEVNVEIKALIIRYNDQPTLINIVRDISERKLADQELIKAKEKAEESDRLKSAFLANMSHEVRTPMNGIIGFANLLKDSKISGEEQQEYISLIEESGARMLNIINDIVDISKIESGQMKLNIGDSNVNDQIEYLYTFFKPEVENKGLQLVFKNSLTSKESIIQTDREKVFAILTNLIKNAIKYSDTGTIKFGYNLKTREPAELEFFVMDHGIGIPKDRQEAIFERFIQADIGDRRAYDGAGLGLAIAKSYVEMLGGRIRVDSEQGKGSIFYFTLPYNFEKAKEVDTTKAYSATNMNVLDRKLTILIAEDNDISKKLIYIAIKLICKEVFTVRTGIEAVETCKNNPDIDLVLMDIQMPETNGYEATRQIREFNKDVIIIAQTAYGLAGDREKAIEAGCNDYISKPINTVVLIGLIQKYFTN